MVSKGIRMTNEEIEKTTIDNARNIGELTVIAKQTSKDVDKLITHLDSLPTARIVSIEKRMGNVEEANKGFMSGALLKWMIGGVLTAILLFVAHTDDVHTSCKDKIHKIDSQVVAQKVVNENIEKSLNRHEKFLGMPQTTIRAEDAK